MRKRKMVGRYEIPKPKPIWSKTTYLKDGKILKTVHDGSFSPGGEEPYTPAPWLRFRGDSFVEDGETIRGGSVQLVLGVYTVKPTIEYSTDGESWQQAELTEQEMGGTMGVFTDIFDLDEGEVVYFRAGETATDSLSLIMVNNGAVYADGNAYAVFSRDETDWDVLRGVSFMGGAFGEQMSSSGLTHLPDLLGYEIQSELIEEQGYFVILSSMFQLLGSGVVMSDDGYNFNFHLGITLEMLLDEMAQQLPPGTTFDIPNWDFSMCLLLSGLGNGSKNVINGFLGSSVMFIDEDNDIVPASELESDGLLTHNGEAFRIGNFVDSLIFRDGRSAAVTLTQDGEGLPVIVTVVDNETQTQETIPLTDGKFSISGLPSPSASIVLENTYPPYTAKVISSDSENGTLDKINNIAGITAVNYQSLDYDENYTKLLYTQEHGKTVDIAIADPYTPLAFYKSTDNGITWTSLQPSSTAPSSTAHTTVYSFAAADGDIIKIVRSATKTVTVVTTTPSDSSYGNWNNYKNNIYPENYLTKTYRGDGGVAKAQVNNPYLDITTGVAKTVDMYIQPDYAPLTFKKSTDSGVTWSDIQAASVSQNIYSFSLDDGDWLNIVRGGDGPEIIVQ